jgi:hypothetical protein
VASLKDQMLLGMEFLHQRKARLDLENGVMTLDRDTVPMTFGRAEGPLDAQILTVQCEDRDVPPRAVLGSRICRCGDRTSG